jgi:hypothetical protein
VQNRSFVGVVRLVFLQSYQPAASVRANHQDDIALSQNSQQDTPFLRPACCPRPSVGRHAELSAPILFAISGQPRSR